MDVVWNSMGKQSSATPPHRATVIMKVSFIHTRKPPTWQHQQLMLCGESFVPRIVHGNSQQPIASSSCPVFFSPSCLPPRKIHPPPPHHQHTTDLLVSVPFSRLCLFKFRPGIALKRVGGPTDPRQNIYLRSRSGPVEAWDGPFQLSPRYGESPAELPEKLSNSHFTV